MNELGSELARLRGQGVTRASPAAYPVTARLVQEHFPKASDVERRFPDYVAKLFRDALTPFSGHSEVQIILELFCLDQRTTGKTPQQAKAICVARLRGASNPRTNDAFRKNEQARAFAFLESVLVGNQGSHQDGLLPRELIAGLVAGGVTHFFPSRHYYATLREGRPSIAEYVAQATHSLEMISINLATGHDMENVIDTFDDMISRRPPVRIRISLLDPEQAHLAQAIAPVIKMSPETLIMRVNDALGSLTKFSQSRLSASRRQYFELWCHGALPNGSAIIIDGDEPHGCFQLETKGYQTGLDKSFGFECSGSEFFRSLRDSYRQLLNDGRRLL